MGQGAAKAKSEGEKDAQMTDKDNKMNDKKSNAARDELLKFMRERYREKVQPAKSFDEFYHAIYELIEMFCESRGQLQYRIPSKEELLDQYKKVQPKKGKELSKDDFEKIARGILKVDSFTFGKAAVDILVVLFGLPVCAVVTKRLIPGLKSISDDIVIPAATSGAVVYLAKTNKL
ncbi:hypothetical protein QOZ80_5AG0374880 [Eleusine coracana subsp. coracana]|nr:hypothetical protein QOZ80_5AG0374880 [Eleusine coracana subsp. coracana]